MPFPKNVRNFAATITGAVLLSSGSTRIQDPVEQKREEILIAMNAVLMEQGVTYPPNTTCLAYVFQKNEETTGKVMSVLYCGDAFPLVTKVQNVTSSDGAFSLELVISGASIDETGIIDKDTGCVSAQILKNNETREIDTCGGTKVHTSTGRINT